MARKRKLQEEDAVPPLDNLDAWASHPRLLRHVRCLVASKNPRRVLKRYKDRAHDEGQRCCVHVAAWVALLPEESELLKPAAELLATLLATRPKTRYGPWFLGCLKLVARRLSKSDAPMWKELKQHLPRRVWQDSEATELETKRLHTAMTKWHNGNPTERILMLKKIHDTFSQALAISPTSTATLALRQKLLQLTLRKAVAALAAPRAACGAVEKIAREEREGTHEPSQQELRSLLLKALQEVNLKDVKLKPVLSHLQQLILQLQQPLEEAACAAQWLMISAFLQSWEDSNRHERHGRWSEAEKRDVWQFLQDRLSRYAEPNSVLFAKAALNFGRSSSAIKAFWRARTDLRYAPSAPEGLKHHRGIIKQMVGHAMRKLGGEATSLELIDFIGNDVEMQETYGHRLQTHMTKINGNMNAIPAWQRTVRTNVDRYLKHTGKKRHGRLVYRLKSER